MLEELGGTRLVLHSVMRYMAQLGWWAVGILGGAVLSVVLLLVGDSQIPKWILAVAAIGGFVIGPFLAYHRLWLHLEKRHIDSSLVAARLSRWIGELRGLAVDQANVQVQFASLQERELADRVLSAFRLAGWATDITNVPLEDPRNAPRPYMRETEVQGANTVLVDAAAKGLDSLGYVRVKRTVTRLEPTTIKQANWVWFDRHVKILIGHQEE